VESKTLARWERKKLQAAAVKGSQYGERFIPARDTNKDLQLLQVSNENLTPETQQEFNTKLAESLFEGASLNSKVLAFKQKAPKPTEGFSNSLRVIYTQNTIVEKSKKAFRSISSTPERILDAPEMADDFYLNLLDWSSSNLLAVGLGPSVYLWNATSGDINLLCENTGEEMVTSVKWMQDGSHLAIGTSDNVVQLWNIERQKRVRAMKGHSARVTAMAWNNHVLSSGSRDTNIFHNDVRVAKHHIATLQGHEQEICGLQWSPDGSQLASGGNDNLVCIWDADSVTPKHVLRDSSAAVKALAWCPFERNLLATGGGTADRHIRFYNSVTGSMINSIDTKSQVCSLIWSPHEREIMSSHGFSQNQLTVWKYPTMVKVAELTGHTSRVLHTALSADGTTVCSAAADETLRFWKIWEAKTKKVAPSKEESSRRTLQAVNIR